MCHVSLRCATWVSSVWGVWGVKDGVSWVHLCVVSASVMSWSCLSLSLSLSLFLPNWQTHTQQDTNPSTNTSVSLVWDGEMPRWLHRDASMATSCRSCAGGWAPKPLRATEVKSAFGRLYRCTFSKFPKSAPTSRWHKPHQTLWNTPFNKISRQNKRRNAQQDKKWCRNGEWFVSLHVQVIFFPCLTAFFQIKCLRRPMWDRT